MTSGELNEEIDWSDGPPQAEWLFSRYIPQSFIGRFRNFPLVRFLVATLFLLPVFGINMVVVFGLIDHLPEPAASWVDMARLALTLPAIIYAYSLYCQIIEHRKANEFGRKGALKEGLAGILVAVFIIGSSVAIMAAFGVYKIDGFNDPSIVLNFLLLYITGSLMQEVTSRLLIFRLTEEFLGTWAAIVIASVIAGLVHAANPNQTPLSVFTLIITAFLFIGPFILTRRIWMIWGIHFGWNFTQAGVFGMPNSGIPFPGWIKPVIDGPAWLTGGSVGVENSALTIGLTLFVSAVVLIVVLKRKQFVGPMWRR